MLQTAPEDRTEKQKKLANEYGSLLTIKPAELKKIDADYRQEAERTEREVVELNNQKRSEPRIRALWDRGSPSPTYILLRGEHTNPRRLVGPGVPSVLTDGRTLFNVKPPWPGANKTGRRLALSKWLLIVISIPITL